MKSPLLAAALLLTVPLASWRSPDSGREEVEVVIPGPEEGIELAGTLLLPAGASPNAPVAGIVLVTGSGPQDRDESLAGKQPFRVLAEGLVERGYAVLRYDDRGTAGLGIGKSTGSFAGSTTQDFAEDAAAVVEFLGGVNSVDPKRIVLCGHSTGGLVTAKLLGSGRVPAAAVLLASPAVQGSELLAHQSEVIALATQKAKGTGLSDEQLARMNELQSELIRSEVTDDVERKNAAGEAVVRFNMELGGVDPSALTAEQFAGATEAAFAALRDPWMRHFLRYDPREHLESATVPVLALFGGLDLQVVPEQNLPPMSAALRKAGHPASTVVVIEASNHLFQTAETGLLDEYGTLEGEMQPLLINLVASWLDSVL